MIQRSISRPISPYIAHTAPRACAVCTCNCGSRFRRHAFSTTPSASVQPRAAPITWRREQEEQSKVLNPSTAQHEAQLGEKRFATSFQWWDSAYRGGRTRLTFQAGSVFVDEFWTLALNGGPRSRSLDARWGIHVLDPALFTALCQKHEVTERDLLLMTSSVMQLRKSPDRVLGRCLMFTWAASGSEEATLRICTHAWIRERSRPGTLKIREISRARERLREIANEGQNFRAMVLEGKLAHDVGDDDLAIRMWNAALPGAVAYADDEARSASESVAPTELQFATFQPDDTPLSAPWIELALIHYGRTFRLWKAGRVSEALEEREKSRAAAELGCRQDDPESHYQAAAFFQDDVNGEKIVTSTWLYNMTKAAVSGHVQAAHALTEFYVSSGWKYIEDEPPDHVKPTPFDSYPLDVTTPTSLWSRLQHFLGARPSNTTKLSAKENIFHSAVFPSTPHGRLELGMRWLDSALAYFHAPSFLLLAKIHLQKTLWAQAQAPGPALQMTPERYTYASKADRTAGVVKVHSQPGEAETLPAAEDPPNPVWAPEKARHAIREVFFAVTSARLRKRRLAEERAKRARRRDESAADEPEIDETDLKDEHVPWNIRKWFRYPAVREIYEDEIDALEAEAMRLCEENRWDIRDETGGLIYKHGLSNVTPQTMGR